MEGSGRHKYEILLYGSDEDRCHVAEVPELAGCMSHGANQLEALKNITEATDLWIETSKEFNDPIPEPKGRKLMFA